MGVATVLAQPALADLIRYDWTQTASSLSVAPYSDQPITVSVWVESETAQPDATVDVRYEAVVADIQSFDLNVGGANWTGTGGQVTTMNYFREGFGVPPFSEVIGRTILFSFGTDADFGGATYETSTGDVASFNRASAYLMMYDEEAETLDGMPVEFPNFYHYSGAPFYARHESWDSTDYISGDFFSSISATVVPEPGSAAALGLTALALLRRKKREQRLG